MLKIPEVLLFDGDTKKENVAGRDEYFYVKRVKNVEIDEETQEDVVSYKYYHVSVISYYTSKEVADSLSTDQPFKTDRVKREITEEQFDSFIALSYTITKEEDFYKNCEEI